MNSTQRRLSAAAWAMLEALSRLRKSVQKELDFLHSISPQLKPDKLETALTAIDDFSSEVSGFLSNAQHDLDDANLETEYEGLNERYQSLSDTIGQILGR